MHVGVIGLVLQSHLYDSREVYHNMDIIYCDMASCLVSDH